MARAPRKPPKPRKPPAAPTEHSLHDAALTHLARYGATQSGLLHVLNRRIARWAASDVGDPDQAAALRQAAKAIVAKLAESGAVSDQAYATARSRTLLRAGKSGRAIGAHLSSKGVPAEVSAALRAPDALGAAAIHLRRRRLGPFRTDPDAPSAGTPDTRRRELASLARAGFAQSIAKDALALSRDEAEALIVQFRADI